MSDSTAGVRSLPTFIGSLANFDPARADASALSLLALDVGTFLGDSCYDETGCRALLEGLHAFEQAATETNPVAVPVIRTLVFVVDGVLAASSSRRVQQRQLALVNERPECLHVLRTLSEGALESRHIVKATGRSRPAVYAALRRLRKVGLVSLGWPLPPKRPRAWLISAAGGYLLEQV